MPLLLAIFTLLTPRVTIIVLWFLSQWFEPLFSSPLLPLAGFVFLPTTLLWYSIVHHWFGGVWALWPAVGLVVAVVIDLVPVREQYRLRNRRLENLAASTA